MKISQFIPHQLQDWVEQQKGEQISFCTPTMNKRENTKSFWGVESRSFLRISFFSISIENMGRRGKGVESNWIEEKRMSTDWRWKSRNSEKIDELTLIKIEKIFHFSHDDN